MALSVGAAAMFMPGELAAFRRGVPVDPQRGAVSPTTTPASPSAQTSTAKPADPKASAQEPRRGDGPPRPGSPEWFALSWEWWQDAEVRLGLKLTEEKARKIQGIFDKRYSQMKPFGDDFEKEYMKLEQMTRERVADEATYALQVSRVEGIGAKLRESRTVMLYAIYRELSPEQNRKLQEIRDQRRNRNGRGGSSSKSH